MRKLLPESIKKIFLQDRVLDVGEGSLIEGPFLENQQGMSSLEDPILNFNKINSVVNREARIIVADMKGFILYINEKCSSSLGYDPEELMGTHAAVLKSEVHSGMDYREIRKTLHAGDVWKGEIAAKRKDGAIMWYFTSVHPLFDDKGKPYQFLTISREITDVKELEKQALLKDEQLNLFFGILTDIFAGCMDQNGRIMYVSSAVESILGYKDTEIEGLNVFDILNPEEILHFRSMVDDLMKMPNIYQTMEVNVTTKSGEMRLCEFTFKNCLHDPILREFIFTCRQVDERKMENLEYIDPLTGLPNQRHLEEQLNQEIDVAKDNNLNLAIVKVGIDDFKYINSAFGHSTGDQLLKDFSTRMKSILNENLIVYKWSGDNLTILIKNIADYDEIHKTLDKLIELVSKEPFTIDGNDVLLTVSMGASVFPYAGENVDDLFKNAEVAMYHAKHSGKNQYQIFSSTMSLNSYKEFILRNDSKKALLRNEFDTYFQPRVHAVTNEMESAEALIRWIHPEWGLVLPDEFISMAEDSGLIIPIGEWMIRNICSKLKKWEEENLPIKKISINLSTIQLIQTNFVDMVSSVLKEFSVSSKWIEFEITESVFIENEEQVLKTLTSLKNLGITIALDDFGTGYSSLNYLRKFPCDIVKIDKSLIKDIHRDQDNFEIISSIISLCHKLHKSVVAEGVETEEQLSLLRKLNCNELQGYYFSRPVGENEYKRFLLEGMGGQKKEAVASPKENKRQFFRVPLKVPLLTDMTIEQIENKRVNIGNTEIKIRDIGPGGLCFLSTLKLPVRNGVVFRFATEIFSKELQLMGNVVWQKEIEDHHYQYGVRFILNNKDREELVKVFNNLQIKLRERSVLPDCRFYTDYVFTKLN